MTVAFDPATGRLRLDRAHFDTLLAWCRGRRMTADTDLEPLRGTGVVHGDRLHPAVAPALAAAANPTCRLETLVYDDTGDRLHAEAWLAPEAAVFLLPLPEGVFELVTTHPTYAPAVVARLVRLAPRPRLAGSGPLQVSAEVFEALLSADADVRRSAAALVDRDAEPALAHLVNSLASGSWQVWTTQATWPGSDGRALHVVDTRAGACLVEATHDTVMLWPTHPTQLWRLLIRLLPDAAEIPTPREPLRSGGGAR
jgi:hypothetical protein